MIVLTTPLFALVACTGGSAAGGDTEATGSAMYRDAATDSDGADVEPAQPESQPNGDPMMVYITVEGSGTFSVPEPECQLDAASGSFEGLYSGEADIDGDGIYVASMSSTEADLTTPSGCTIPDLSIGTLLDVVVRAELSATQQNCESYCESSARAEAESECGGDAGCRGEAEAEWSAGCETECTSSTTHVIVAEASLGAGALADVNAGALTGSALGTLAVDLTFDHIEDGDGNTVDEAP